MHVRGGASNMIDFTCPIMNKDGLQEYHSMVEST